MISVYLDVCCLNRPFDDQVQTRVGLETVAILTILRRVSRGEWRSIGSEALEQEIDNDTNLERKHQVREFAALAYQIVLVEQNQSQRAEELQRLGFDAFDALHLACAELSGADIFLTVDDRLLRLANRLKNQIGVKVANPALWLLEILHPIGEQHD